MSKCIICNKEFGSGDTADIYGNYCNECLQKYISFNKIYIPQDLSSVQVIECQQCKQKDQRIAELEEELASQNSNELVKKKYDSLKEAIKFLWEKQITDEHIFYVIDKLGQQHIDRIQDIENGICEIERLEKELAELKHDLAVRDKALEEVVMDVCYFRDNIAIKTTKKHYLKQAEKEIKIELEEV